MRGLMAAVIGMGIMIVAGVTVLVVVMVQRMSAPPTPNASAVIAVPAASSNPADILIDEPAGTHIATLSLSGDRLALQLTGGGQDRVVVVDTRTGRIVARTNLAR